MAKASRLEILMGVDDASIRARPRKTPLPPGWWHEEEFDPGDGGPSPQQTLMIEDTVTETIIFGGSERGGKTTGVIWKWAKWSWEYPGISLMHGRLDFTDVRSIIFEKMALPYYERIRDRYNLQFTIEDDAKLAMILVRWANGSTIEFRGLSDPRKFKGASWHGAHPDEAGDLSEKSLLQVFKRLSGSADSTAKRAADGFPRQMIGTLNYTKGYIDHAIVRPALRKEPNPTYGQARFILSTPYDLEKKYNRISQETGQPTYMQRIINTGLATEREMRDGWLAPEGTVWRALTDIGPRRDIISKAEFLADWGGPIRADERVYYAVDHGVGDPTVIYRGVIRFVPGTAEKVLIVGGERCEPLKDRPHIIIANWLREAIAPAGNHYGWAEAKNKSGKHQSGDVVTTFLRQMQRAGLTCARAIGNGPNEKLMSIQCVSGALWARRLVLIDEETEELQREWDGYMKAGKNAPAGVDPALPLKDCKDDHCCDTIRYLVNGVVSLGLIDVGKEMMTLLAEWAVDVERVAKVEEVVRRTKPTDEQVRIDQRRAGVAGAMADTFGPTATQFIRFQGH